MDLEMWMMLLTACCAVVPWAFSMHAKVAVIASAVESLPQVVEEIKRALEEHEERLEEHAEKIQALQSQSHTGR
jgi:ABC-type molybdate transport system permease subunit